MGTSTVSFAEESCDDNEDDPSHLPRLRDCQINLNYNSTEPRESQETVRSAGDQDWVVVSPQEELLLTEFRIQSDSSPSSRDHVLPETEYVLTILTVLTCVY